MPPKAKKRKTSGAAATTAPTTTTVEETTDVKVKTETEEKVGGDAKEELSPDEKKLGLFAKYYKEIGIVPDNEWKQFVKENLTLPPLTFRFLESHRLCPSHMDTVPGIPSQAVVLREYMKKKYAEVLNKLTVGSKKQVQLQPLDWYPNELGWSLNITSAEIDKYLSLKEFDNFINSEKLLNGIQKLETWSMFPHTLLSIQPYHKVLDMCAAPGFIAGQISEAMHSDPSLAHEGVLVLNDLYKLADKMQFKWTQGTKTVFTNCDARTYPELHTVDTNPEESPLRYDRIVCDVRCSNDGTMRKHVNIQDNWNSKLNLIYHSEQKAILRRALELAQFGGQVLYSTTSYNPIENEAVVMALLKECEGSVLLVDVRNLAKPLKFRPGMTTWKVMTPDGVFIEKYADATEEFKKENPESMFPPPIKEANAYHMERCIRVCPQDNNTAGFFCAMLVKNSELPWIKAKKHEEMLAKMKNKGKPEPPKLKQYGYRIRLKCNVALTEVEWTKSETDESLETTSTVEVETFDSPPLEIDPNCMPRRLVADADAFTFCDPADNQAWLKMKAFYKISDDFDASCILFKNFNNEVFLTTPYVKSLITLNRNREECKVSTNVGVKLFHRLPKIWIPVTTPCSYMMTNQGFSCLFPYIGKQIVNITKDDMLMLAYNERVKIEELSEQAQTDIKETEQGCILFLYRPEDITAVPNCNLTFVGVRGEKYITDFKDGHANLEKKTTYRLCGMELEDYKRKIQEEKLAKALEKEKEDKLKKEQEELAKKAAAEEKAAETEKMET